MKGLKLKVERNTGRTLRINQPTFGGGLKFKPNPREIGSVPIKWFEI
jgi:hypothetical protein